MSNMKKEQLRLYAVTDRTWLGNETLYEQVEKALRGGATLVQLREKDLPEADVQKEAEEFGMFLAREGGEQCGFCNPGFIMNVLAMEKELKDPDEEDIKEYLSGNLCRCSGYMSQLRAVKKYLDMKQSGKEA